MIFSASEAERKSIANRIIDIVIRYQGKVNFVTVDAVKHSFTLAPLGLDPTDLPALVIQTTDNVFKLSQGLARAPHDAINDLIQQSLHSAEFNVQ